MGGPRTFGTELCCSFTGIHTSRPLCQRSTSATQSQSLLQIKSEAPTATHHLQTANAKDQTMPYTATNQLDVSQAHKLQAATATTFTVRLCRTLYLSGGWITFFTGHNHMPRIEPKCSHTHPLRPHHSFPDQVIANKAASIWESQQRKCKKRNKPEQPMTFPSGDKSVLMTCRIIISASLAAPAALLQQQ